jgi:hypothetical protein
MSDTLREAAETFRDVILNERGLISENGMTSDQINDVLNEFDKAFDAALAHPKAQEPPVFERRWSIAKDGFGLQRDDENGNYVYIDDAIDLLAAAPQEKP